MAEIAPLNYERWAVVVSPLHGADAQAVVPGFGARNVEELPQVAPSLNNVDARKKESLIEQTLRPAEASRKIQERKPESPPVTSHPGGSILRQPLPMGIFTIAGNQPAPDPRAVTERYNRPEPTPGPAMRISG